MQTIENIANSGEIAAILPLLPQIVDSSQQIARAAGEAVARLVAKCSPEDLTELDASVRWQTDWNLGNEWLRLPPKKVANLPRPNQAQGTVLGLVSFHANGHVREAAVRLLDGLEDGSEIPFLLLRLNDWAEPVQRSARLAIQRRLHTSSVERFANHLYLVFRLLEQRRSDHTSFVQAVVLELTRAEHESLLLQCVNMDNRYVRRTAFRLAADTPGHHLAGLIAAGLRANDPVIRLWAVRKTPLVFESDDLAQQLRLTESDRFMAVRRETLRVRVNHLPDAAHQMLVFALLDRSLGVREEARFHLRQQGENDIATYYRQAILEHRHIAAAIAGLGETGTDADAALALPFLGASESRLRRAAVRTVGRLSPKPYRDALLQRISDDSPRVAFESAKALANGTITDAADQLWAVFRSDPRTHVKLAVLHLLNQLAAWHKVPYLILAATESNKRIATRAAGCITAMYNRVFTRPSTDDGRKVRMALDEAQDGLPPAFEAELRTWVEIWVK